MRRLLLLILLPVLCSATTEPQQQHLRGRALEADSNTPEALTAATSEVLLPEPSKDQAYPQDQAQIPDSEGDKQRPPLPPPPPPPRLNPPPPPPPLPTVRCYNHGWSREDCLAHSFGGCCWDASQEVLSKCRHGGCGR